MQDKTTILEPSESIAGLPLFSRALKHHQSGELDQAENCYRETIRSDGNHADAHHLLGVVALQNGRIDESVSCIRRALFLQPDTAEYHGNLASALRANGDIGGAVDHYRTAVKLNPQYAVAENNLGNVLLESGRMEEAADCFGRALLLAPELQPARESLDRIESMRESTLTEESDRDSRVEETLSQEYPVASQTKTVLHVGCGFPNPESLHERFRGDDWSEVRLDLNPDVQPDIVASLTEMPAVETGSVDAVWSSHNIEHLYAHDVPTALGEFFRVLKPGGLLFLTLPDLQQIAHFIVADKLDDIAYTAPLGPITTLDCVFGYGPAIAEGNEFMAHKTGFTVKTLTARLENAGFEIERVWTTPFNIWAEAVTPQTESS